MRLTTLLYLQPRLKISGVTLLHPSTRFHLINRGQIYFNLFLYPLQLSGKYTYRTLCTVTKCCVCVFLRSFVISTLYSAHVLERIGRTDAWHGNIILYNISHVSAPDKEVCRNWVSDCGPQQVSVRNTGRRLTDTVPVISRDVYVLSTPRWVTDFA